MMTGLLILAFSPGVRTGGVSFPGMDKVAHLLVYGLLGIAWVRTLHPDRFSRVHRFAVAVTLAAGFGLIDEGIQLGTPGRLFEWLDLLADVLGASLFSLAYLASPPLQSLFELNFNRFIRLRSRSESSNSPE